MLKLFRYRTSDRHAMLLLHLIIILMALCSVVIVMSASGQKGSDIRESFLVELPHGYDTSRADDIMDWLIQLPHVMDEPINYIPAATGFDKIDLDVPRALWELMVTSGHINDVLVFTTTQFESEKSRGEFLVLLSNNNDIASARKMGEITQSDTLALTFSKLLPLSIFFILLLDLFALSLLKREILALRSEIRMLAFSGVSDRLILSKLRSSMGVAVVKAWLITVFLVIVAFYIGLKGFINNYVEFSIQDVLVALTIPLVIMLVSMSLYTKSRADRILKKI